MIYSLKGTKFYRDYQLLKHISYPELRLVELIYSKFNEASNNYAERRKEFDENWYKERQEKRKVQGFETHEQITEWAPEFPENIHVWMRYIGERAIRDSAEPEFA